MLCCLVSRVGVHLARDDWIGGPSRGCSVVAVVVVRQVDAWEH